MSDTVHCIRHRTILNLVNERDGDVTFDKVTEDKDECTVLRIDRAAWEDLGSPRTLTVVVHPLDILNPSEEADAHLSELARIDAGD